MIEVSTIKDACSICVAQKLHHGIALNLISNYLYGKESHVNFSQHGLWLNAITHIIHLVRIRQRIVHAIDTRHSRKILSSEVLDTIVNEAIETHKLSGYDDLVDSVAVTVVHVKITFGLIRFGNDR